jgi:hypothetical protein
MYALITVVRLSAPKGWFAYSSIVLIIGWFAYSPVKPSFVEECNNSPTLTLVVAVGREDEIGENCRTTGRDVVLR